MSLKRKAADIALEAAKKPKQNASITAFFGQPKPTVSSPATSASNKATITSSAPSSSQPASSPTAPFPVAETTATPKFDKTAWLAKLSPEQQELLKLEIHTLDESWLAVLKDEVTSREFLDLKRFLKKEAETGKKIFPPSEDVYSWYAAPLPLYSPKPFEQDP